MSLGASLILAGFHGLSAQDEGPRALVELGVGGYIVFGRNVADPAQVATLLAGLDRASGGKAIFAVDQEGGRVARLRAPMTVWPPMGRLGGHDDPDLTRGVARALGAELAAVGFTLDFAPVLDVNNNPENPVIGDRSFGADPTAVAARGAAFVTGLLEAGLLACGKHFPGHGDVTVDSHEGLPVCAASLADLWDTHIAPFRRAIAVGLPAIMTAHVLYPAVDAQEPATTSKRWLSEVLRGELGFDGVILTDDLEMGAIAARSSVPDACVAALRAGCDGLLICKSLQLIRESAVLLDAEIAADPGFRHRCEDARRRLDQLAQRRPAPAGERLLASRIGTPAHEALARRAGELVVGLDPTERGV